MNYSVGQIIYLLSKKDIKVYPVQVIEEVTRKTIEQEIVSYVIKLPDEKETEILLDAVDAEVFTSIQDVEKRMMENASVQIKSFLKDAKSMSKIFKDIPSHEPAPSEKLDSSKQSKKDKSKKKQDTAEIDLGNGIKGKINLSSLPV